MRIQEKIMRNLQNYQMLRLKSIFVMACLTAGLDVVAQCGTDQMAEIAEKRDATLAARKTEMINQALAYAKQPQSRAAIYTIPVVFHIIHTGGPENISRDQILDQMRILNNDYQLKNWNKGAIRSQFASRAADCQIQFKLATVDPTGNCTDGINRVYSPLGVNVDQNTEEVKSLAFWTSSTQKYLNIWVVTSITSSSGSGTTLGYAYFPWMTPSNKNGVVLRSDRVGSIGSAASTGDSGRTLTHEVGHWLGLYHTFQGDCFGQGDFCDDTPPVTGTFVNANCPANGNSCTNDNPDMLDMWEDYMDYSDGKCMAMFSTQQKGIMHGYLQQSPRSSVVSSSNLIATGITTTNVAPKANFAVSQRVVCAGTPVTFYDISCKAAVTARVWTFAGSSTPSRTEQNPSVVYQTAGKYTVKLDVQNAKGSDSKTVTEYITVISPSSSSYPNLEETFENGDPNGHGYRNVSPRPWEMFNSAGFTGTHCYMAPVKSTDTPGTVFSFTTPPVDLTKLASSTPRFTFYTSYLQSDANTAEELRIYISTDCGNTYTQIYSRAGTALQYTFNATPAGGFVPTQTSQWKRLGLTSLTAYTSHKAVIFKIDVISAAGNPVYVDNINISEWYAGAQTIEKDRMEMRIYPNPVKESATIDVDVNSPIQGTVELYDMAGKKISEIFSGTFITGRNTLNFSNPGVSNGSIYLVKITTNEGQITKAITFAP